MSYYRVQYKDRAGKPIEDDDILLEEVDMKQARWYAEHRVDGSYGDLDMVLHKIKRISRDEAIRMFNSNCIAWCGDPEDY